MHVSKAQLFNEKWGTDYETPEAKKGMFAGRSQESLKAEYEKLKGSGPHEKGSAGFTKMKELSFALRAKHSFGKVPK